MTMILKKFRLQLMNLTLILIEPEKRIKINSKISREEVKFGINHQNLIRLRKKLLLIEIRMKVKRQC